MEAEMGVVWPQVKECQELPQARKIGRMPPTEPLEGMWPYQYLHFGLSGSRIVRE